jgi:hypothetical protein
MSRITHSLVGYNRASAAIVEEFDVPDAVLSKARELACVPADDPGAIMCYALDDSRARDLANLLHAKIDIEQCDYFLEGYAYEFADDAEFRPEALDWSVWIRNDIEKKHVKVTVARRTLDDYASSHGHKDHRAVIDLLNARINGDVAKTIARGLDDGRAASGQLELTEEDLGAIFDE